MVRPATHAFHIAVDDTMEMQWMTWKNVKKVYAVVGQYVGRCFTSSWPAGIEQMTLFSAKYFYTKNNVQVIAYRLLVDLRLEIN